MERLEAREKQCMARKNIVVEFLRVYYDGLEAELIKHGWTKVIDEEKGTISDIKLTPEIIAFIADYEKKHNYYLTLDLT